LQLDLWMSMYYFSYTHRLNPTATLPTMSFVSGGNPVAPSTGDILENFSVVASSSDPATLNVDSYGNEQLRPPTKAAHQEAIIRPTSSYYYQKKKVRRCDDGI
jgi:hypothetical protein